MKVEEKIGFDAALDLDNEVWKVMPKIQARMIKSMLKLNNGSDALFKGLTAKLELEGFKFKAEKNKNGFRITIKDCPWHNLMVKSGRKKLSGIVGTLFAALNIKSGSLNLLKQCISNFSLKNAKNRNIAY